jgi:hypothetical protein
MIDNIFFIASQKTLANVVIYFLFQVEHSLFSQCVHGTVMDCQEETIL